MKLKVRHIPWYLTWKGLLGSQPQATLFYTRFGIHTFGMNYPIDVVILDNKAIVQKIKENLQPNRFFFWNPLYKTVLELPEDTVKKLGLTCKQHVVLQTF